MRFVSVIGDLVSFIGEAAVRAAGAGRTCSMGVMPVPPATMPMVFFMLGL